MGGLMNLPFYLFMVNRIGLIQVNQIILSINNCDK